MRGSYVGAKSLESACYGEGLSGDSLIAKMTTNNLVTHGFANPRANLLLCVTGGKDRPAIDRDLVRRHQIVRARSGGQGNALVEAEQVVRVIHACQFESFIVRQFLDDDRDVCNMAAQFSRQLVQGLLD